jgi:hypothetical protein
MKKKTLTKNNFQVITKSELLLIKGGNEEEYRIIYIYGVPYRIKINKKGEQISEPEIVL